MRTAHRSHEELERLLERAIRCLESADLHGANEALKRANAAAATLDDDALPPEPGILKSGASGEYGIELIPDEEVDYGIRA